MVYLVANTQTAKTALGAAALTCPAGLPSGSLLCSTAPTLTIEVSRVVHNTWHLAANVP